MIIFCPKVKYWCDVKGNSIEFQTEEEMKKYICKEYKELYKKLGYDGSPFEISDIVIDSENPIDDERIGWHDTMYVSIKRFGEEDYIKEYGVPSSIGTCATDYER